MAEKVNVYVRPDDPDCALVVHWLRERGVEHSVRDVTSDPSASAVLFGRLGRIVVPVVEVGSRLVVGYDPIQLARMVPRPGEEQPQVSFGAAVRSVSAELAGRRGLPYLYGVEVGSVREASPAAVAGIRAGDIITKIGPYTLQGGADQFRAAVAARQPGDTMALTVLGDDGERLAVVEFPSLQAETSEP